MKIVTNNPKDLYEDSFYIEIITNEGKASVGFGGGEPEDNCLARDLNDAFKIPKMLKMAYEAGKNGEELEEIENEEN